ncbi:response regulator [Flavobacterium sp.]|uniref:response regulator n=1 Tax=Flavobacterium sp. TaxID=239 RepID=UPI003F69AA40
MEEIKLSKIFIVDDIQSNIDLIIEILKIEGFSDIHFTTESHKALENISFLKPDLIIVDLMMPKVSGFDILEHLNKSKEENWIIPVLVLTASNNPADKLKALKLGATEFLTKPLDITETSLRIKNILTTSYLFKTERNLRQNLEEKIRERTRDLEIAKNEAEKNELKYRNLFNANSDAISISSIKNEKPSYFLESNPANKILSDYEMEEFKTLTIYDFIQDERKEQFDNMISKLEKNEIISFETTAKSKKGKIKNIEAKCILIEYNGEKAILNIFRDITERTKFIEAMIAQNKVLKDIAWSQSHEVRAPLATLIGLVNLISEYDEKEFQTDGKEILKMIKKYSDDLDQIIKKTSEKTYISNLFTNPGEL